VIIAPFKLFHEVAMSIDILAASKTKKSELRDMLTAYLGELNQYGDVDLEYRYFDSYWTDNDRWPYIIVKDQHTAGFALINTWSPSGKGTDFAVAEFCIVPDFRASGVGRCAFASLLCTHPGFWEVSVMSNNEAGKAFWQRTLETVSVSKIETVNLDGEVVHRFSNKP
jgi:predicted acetyltransferase